MAEGHAFDEEGLVADAEALGKAYGELGLCHPRSFVYRAVELTPEDHPHLSAYVEAVGGVLKGMLGRPDAEPPHAYLCDYASHRGWYSPKARRVADGEDAAMEGSIEHHYVHAAERLLHDFDGRPAVFISPSTSIAESVWVLAHEYGHWADDALLGKDGYALPTDTGDERADGVARFLNALRREAPGEVLGIHCINALSRESPWLAGWAYGRARPEAREAALELDRHFEAEFGCSVTEVVRDAERLADFVEKASDHVPASSCVFYNTVRPLFEDAKPEYKAFADRLLAEHDRLWEHSVLTAERARDQPYHSRRELLATASELIRRDDFFSGEGDGYWKRRAGEVGDAAAKEEMVERLAEELRREADGHRDERFTLAVQVLELLMPTGFLIPDALAARMLERFDAYDCYELVGEVYALGEGERRGAGEGGG